MINYVKFWVARDVAGLVSFFGAIALLICLFALIYVAALGYGQYCKLRKRMRK